MEEKNVKILQLVGSVDDDMAYKTSFHFASATKDFDCYQFKFAVFQPQNGKVKFPSKLDDITLKECREYDVADAVSVIMDISPAVILHQMYGVISCTRLRAFIETLGFPLIGPDAEKHYITCNKAYTRAHLKSAGVSIPPGMELYNNNNDSYQCKGILDDQAPSDYLKELDHLGYPCVVKAACLEDSRGVSKVHNSTEAVACVQEAFEMGHEVVIEKFIQGKELRCCVIEGKNGEIQFLPVLQYDVDENKIRSFKERWAKDDDKGNIIKKQSNRWYLDPVKERDIIEKLKVLCYKAFHTLRLVDFAVFDIRMGKDGKPYIIEVNLYCAYNENSFVNKAAHHVGITKHELLQNAIENTIRRNKNKH